VLGVASRLCREKARLALLLLFPLLHYSITPSLRAADLITATVTVTNKPVTSNTFYYATTAASLRTWTNNTTASTILTNQTGLGPATTNLFNALASYPSVGVGILWQSSNVITLRGVSLVVTQGGNWASITFSTNTGTALRSLAIPFDNLPTTNRTNNASDTLSGLARYATNGIDVFTNLATSNTLVKPLFDSLTTASGFRLPLRALSSDGAGVLSMTATSVVVAVTRTTNALHVAKHGTDSTTCGTLSQPCLSCGQAKTNAASGQTIYVWPGTYEEKDLLKTGVNWHFVNGAIVTNDSGALAIFDASAASAISVISGDGVFLASTNARVMDLSFGASVIHWTARVIASGTTAIQAELGTLTLERADVYSAETPLVIADTTAVVNLQHCALRSSNTNLAALAISITAANNDLTLRECVLYGGANATNSIRASTSVNARIYNGVMASATNYAVTFITGASQFEIDADVR
jgi:hypothetical protein